MSRRVSIVLAALVILGQAALAGVQPAAAFQGGDGNSYTSPTYDWSISWTDDWTVTDEDVDDVYDTLQLSDGLSEVMFLSYEGFDGDPVACVEDKLELLEDVEGFSDVELGTDRNGEPLQGEDDTGAYAVYTFTFSPEEGDPFKMVEYTDCRTLVPGEAVLDISQITLREAYNDAAPKLQALLDTLTMPGEDPIESDDGDDADQTEETLSDDEVIELVDGIRADITAYWTEQFERHDLFYVEPIYVVVVEEGEVPCGGGQVIDRGSGSKYCPLNQTVYFDMLQLEQIQEQTEVSGLGTLLYVLSHETGHDVQMQLGITLTGTLSVETELEADCMAGSFLRSMVDEGELTEDEFLNLINVALYIGDPEGTRATDEGSHGLGSQRVTMLLRGYYNGVDTCGTFDDMLAPAR